MRSTVANPQTPDDPRVSALAIVQDPGYMNTDFTALTPNTSYDGDTGLISIAGQQGGEDSGYASGNGSNAFTHRAEERQP